MGEKYLITVDKYYVDPLCATLEWRGGRKCVALHIPNIAISAAVEDLSAKPFRHQSFYFSLPFSPIAVCSDNYSRNAYRRHRE